MFWQDVNRLLSFIFSLGSLFLFSTQLCWEIGPKHWQMVGLETYPVDKSIFFKEFFSICSTFNSTCKQTSHSLTRWFFHSTHLLLGSSHSNFIPRQTFSLDYLVDLSGVHSGML